MRQPGSSAQRDRSCPDGEEARAGLTDAGQARYRQIGGVLDEITTRLVGAATSCLLARARWNCRSCAGISSWSAATGGD